MCVCVCARVCGVCVCVRASPFEGVRPGLVTTQPIQVGLSVRNSERERVRERGRHRDRERER